jgi:hypothetical protein
MCKEVVIHIKNGSYVRCGSQSELLKSMSNGLVFHEDAWFNAESCLCSINLKETAILNGYIPSEYDEEDLYDIFDTHFYPIWD